MRMKLPYPKSTAAILLSSAAFFSIFLSRASAVDFDKEIQPILKEHCFRCHSGPRAKAKLRYDNKRYFKERIGDHEDAVVVPGSPDRSKLIKLASLPQTSADAMPPPKARNVKPLTATKLNLIRQWITEGASLEPKPAGEKGEPEETPTPETGALQEWTNIDKVTLKAAFLHLKGDTVRLRKEDGSEFSYPLSKLTEKSQQLAKSLAEKQ